MVDQTDSFNWQQENFLGYTQLEQLLQDVALKNATADIDMQNKYKVKNAVNATNNQDYVTLNQVNSQISAATTNYAILAGQTCNAQNSMMRPFDFPYVKQQGTNIVIDNTGSFTKISLTKGYRYKFTGGMDVTGGAGACEIVIVLCKYTDQTTLSAFVPGATSQSDRRLATISYCCSASISTSTALTGQTCLLDLSTTLVNLDIGVYVEYKSNVPDNTILRNQIIIEQVNDSITTINTTMSLPNTFYYYNEYMFTTGNTSAMRPSVTNYFTGANFTISGSNLRSKLTQSTTSGVFVLQAGNYIFGMSATIISNSANVLKVLVRNYTTNANINAGGLENSQLGCMGVTNPYNEFDQQTIYVNLTAQTQIGFYLQEATNINSTTDIRSLSFYIQYLADSNAVSVATDRIQDSTGAGLLQATATNILTSVPINLNGQKLVNVSPGTSTNDGVNYGQLAAQLGSYYLNSTPLNSITPAAASINVNAQKITNGPSLASAITTGSDYATKVYVDSVIPQVSASDRIQDATFANSVIATAGQTTCSKKLQLASYIAPTDDKDLVPRKYLTDNWSSASNSNIFSYVSGNVCQLWTYDGSSVSTNVLSGADLTAFNHFLFKRSNQTGNYVMDIYPGNTSSSEQTINTYGNWTHKDQNGNSIFNTPNIGGGVGSFKVFQDLVASSGNVKLRVANNDGTSSGSSFFMTPLTLGSNLAHPRIQFSVENNYVDTFSTRTDDVCALFYSPIIATVRGVGNTPHHIEGGCVFGQYSGAPTGIRSAPGDYYAIYATKLTNNTDDIVAYFSGRVAFTGYVVVVVSDQRLKKNIRPNTNLDDLAHVDFKHFEFDEDAMTGAGIPMQEHWRGCQTGVIAQEVPVRYQQKSTLNPAYLTVDYDKIKTDMLQYHQQQIRDLQSMLCNALHRIEQLEKMCNLSQ